MAKLDDTVMQGIKDFAAGGAAGIAQIVSSHPLDTIKTRMQSDSGKRFAGAWDLTRQTIKHEGFLGLYKGMLSPLSGVAFVNSVLFAAYGRIARVLHGDSTSLVPIRDVAIAGGAAGLVQSFIASPIEMLKIRLQTQYAGEKLYQGPWDCLTKLWTRHGFAGVFNGLGATLLREGPAYAAWYSMYEFSKRRLIPQGATDVNPVKCMLAGASGGLAYWTACYPLDRAKTLLQSQDLDQRVYRSTVHCIQEIIRKDGVKGLWRGFTPCLLRCLPASSCTFLTFELVSKFLNK